jgi:hypothetical protein
MGTTSGVEAIVQRQEQLNDIKTHGRRSAIGNQRRDEWRNAVTIATQISEVDWRTISDAGQAMNHIGLDDAHSFIGQNRTIHGDPGGETLSSIG